MVARAGGGLVDNDGEEGSRRLAVDDEVDETPERRAARGCLPTVIEMQSLGQDISALYLHLCHST